MSSKIKLTLANVSPKTLGKKNYEIKRSNIFCTLKYANNLI